MLMRRLGHGCFDGRILFRSRPSIITPLRWIHQVPSTGRRRDEPRDSPPPAAKDPGWVLLNVSGIGVDASFVADAGTVAYSRTSKDQPLRISLGRAPPPASSFIYYDFPDPDECDKDGDDKDDGVDDECDEDGDDKDDGVDDECDEDGDDKDDDECDEDEDEACLDYDVDNWPISVVAAHGDSVLLKMSHPYASFADEHFLYRAGAAGSPSLLFLSDFNFFTESKFVDVHSGTTALLRQGDGDGDVLLVQLYVTYDRDARRDAAKFFLLRPRRGSTLRLEELKEPVPIAHDGGGVEQLRTRCVNTVIPVGDRFLCWVMYESGFLLCDMADTASPRVRYTPLPSGVIWNPDIYDEDDPEDDAMSNHSKSLGAAGAATVRFVSVDPHCCGGGPAGRSTCGASSRCAFTITTWSMKLAMDEPPAWVEDGKIDCEEIWSLPGYEGLPRANLQCPVVSLDDPDVVCFLVTNYHFISSYKDRKAWMIKLNIKTRTLLSVIQTHDPYKAYDHSPVKL